MIFNQHKDQALSTKFQDILQNFFTLFKLDKLHKSDITYHQNSDPNTSDKQTANEAVEATDNHDAINNKILCVVNGLKNVDASNNLFQLYSKFKRKLLKFNMMSPILLQILKIARMMPFRKEAINMQMRENIILFFNAQSMKYSSHYIHLE